MIFFFSKPVFATELFIAFWTKGPPALTRLCHVYLWFFLQYLYTKQSKTLTNSITPNSILVFNKVYVTAGQLFIYF